ncbi:TolB family protein [Spirosoma foliorum]|uniref:PD40 domain-containing protein n=1 Tax=Spirosoma foliorum TaxID=2710596 RepID=A0A7G5GNX8_9BACT|nr:PD40 domain-containing protein [Spirosoma foliorum]QMW00570.1 PD40 domain-containing protein [Spirosoma foliorum]
MLSLTNFIDKILRRSSALHWLILPISFINTCVTFGQNPPDTDIFLVELTGTKEARQVSKPINITQRKGYDNQPSFTPNGQQILFTAMHEDGQTDIYRYDLPAKTTTQLTKTPEGEYSPTVMPDQAYFSVIQMEMDKTQRLWKFPISGNGEPTLILTNVKPVGYHCWLTPDLLALFILGKPNSLQLARVSTGDTTRIEGSIGRSLHKIPGKNALSFVHKRIETEWEIKQLDLKTNQMTTIAPTLPGSEDFVWTPDGALLMGKGPILYQLNPKNGQTWTPLADLSSIGVKQLTRLAIDPKGKKLALVGQ